jgi:hypothetical protein
MFFVCHWRPPQFVLIVGRSHRRPASAELRLFQHWLAADPTGEFELLLGGRQWHLAR